MPEKMKINKKERKKDERCIGSACPEAHPYACNSVNHCCRHPFENRDPSKGESCDGALITLKSGCCMRHEFELCETPPCGDFVWEDPEEGNYLR